MSDSALPCAKKLVVTVRPTLDLRAPVEIVIGKTEAVMCEEEACFLLALAAYKAAERIWNAKRAEIEKEFSDAGVTREKILQCR